MDFNRRNLLKGGVGAGVALGVPVIAGVKAGAVTAPVNIMNYGASITSNDNYSSIMAAINATGAGGTVIVPAGVFKVGQSINIPFKINILGLGNDDHMSTFDFGNSISIGFNFNGGTVGGSMVRNIAFMGSSKAQVYIGGDSSKIINVDLCHFRDPQSYGVQLDGSTLNVTNSKVMGNGTNKGTGFYLTNSSSKATITNCQMSGIFRGIYGGGVDSLTVKNCKVDGMFWHLNKASFSNSLTNITATTFTLAKVVESLSNGENIIATAFEKVTSSATLTPVSDKTDWYTLTGATPEVKMLVSNKFNFGNVVAVDGNNVYIPFFYRWDTYHPTTGPTVKTFGTTVERPYIGIVKTLDRTDGVVDGWRSGDKATLKTPPLNCRLQVQSTAGKQIFVTDSKNFSIDSTMVVNSWGDAIASNISQKLSITNCSIYDGGNCGVSLVNDGGGAVVSGNKTYRQGTASIFISSGGAIVSNNSSFGAQFMELANDAYGAFQIENASNVTIENNILTWGGSSYEDRGMLFDGRSSKSLNVKATNNSFVNYPSTLQHPIGKDDYSGLKEVEITLRGEHTTIFHTVKADGKTVRFQYLDGAKPSQVVQVNGK